MEVRIIKTEEELDKALARMSKLMNLNPPENTPELEEIKLLALVIEDYEDKHYPTPPSDPIEAIKFRMDQQGLKPIDMKGIFGTTARYYEIVNRKRSLSIKMIRGVHKSLDIPADILIGSYISKKPAGKVACKRKTHKEHTAPLSHA